MSDTENANRYTAIARQYDQDWRGANDQEQIAYQSRFLELLGLRQGPILDVGCGTGKDSAALELRGKRVVGLDLSTGMLQTAQENLSSEGLGNRLILANMKAIPFENNSFDGLWNMASLVHVDPETKGQVIAEFNRVMKKGGILHLGVQNLHHDKHQKRIIESYNNWVGYTQEGEIYMNPKTSEEKDQSMSLPERQATGYAYLDERHWYYPTQDELDKLLTSNGFRIIEANGPSEKRLRVFAQKL
jgi:ubiquinone/menaquinone biosynthesis C-methylase UbiE